MKGYSASPLIPWSRGPVICAALLVISSAFPEALLARTLAQKKQLARVEFDHAQELWAQLSREPQSQRTEAEYERVADAYRRVYRTAPVSSKADASAFTAAVVLGEAGRALNSRREAQASIAQYEFLCREYPGSKYRMQALFSIAGTYRDALQDNTKSKANFEKFLTLYPRNRLAPEARAALSQPAAPATDSPSVLEKQPDAGPAAPQSVRSEDLSQETARTVARDDRATLTPADLSSPSGGGRHKQPTMVTGVRHWSTPDYTRVAIDIDDQVKYEAGRVPSPDRIFFDLQSTKLASDLVGKSLEIGDGFLKRIRIAQFKSNMTRVVLEVDPVADYSAFLLPNPYRLIIDIHGKLPAAPAPHPAPQTAVAQTVAPVANPSPAGDSGSQQLPTLAKAMTKPATAHETGGPAAKEKLPEAPVASGAAPASDTKAASGPISASRKEPPPEDQKLQAQDLLVPNIATVPAELADLGLASNEVKATSGPTSGPVVQSVAPRRGSPAASEPQAAAASGRDAHAEDRAHSASAVTHEALPTATGDRSLTRALGLKIGKIVIDAGHGGHDTGTIGPNGLMEKDLVLDVALRLGKMLESRLGAEVVYTRNDDTFVPLETRTAIANKAEADLFISIHANSSHDPSARGVESYYLNFTDSPSAMEVAARENAVSQKSVHELQDLVKKIALKEKIEESREFAADVQDELYTDFAVRAGMRNRGVKKAPFIVLIGANMPSILTEISFVSNPRDEKKLRGPEYREKIADALCRGVARYASGLSGVKLAATSISAPPSSPN